MFRVPACLRRLARRCCLGASAFTLTAYWLTSPLLPLCALVAGSLWLLSGE